MVALRRGRASGRLNPTGLAPPARRLMRDFRDAEVLMAHALREALKTKAVETTHHGCLKLVAKAFGYENGNILPAKITAAHPRSADERTLFSACTGGLTPPKTLYCTFCSKSHDLSKLIGARPCTCAMSASNWARVWSKACDAGGKGAGARQGPRVAALRLFEGKTRAELRAMQQEAHVALGRYEEALRLGTTVLADSAQQTYTVSTGHAVPLERISHAVPLSPATPRWYYVVSGRAK